MIDPHGRFYQNTKGNNKGYTYSPILLDLADKDIANYLKVDMIKYKKKIQSSIVCSKIIRI